jgi:TonB family protein
LEETSGVTPSKNRLQEDIDLVVVAEEKQKAGGLSISVVASFVLHAGLVVWFYYGYKHAPPAPRDTTIARYVQLIQQNPKDFVEAPGPTVEKKSLTAPLSDANRKASMPEPTGPNPTKRPGEGGGLYTPPVGSRAQQPQTAAQQAQPQNASAQQQTQAAPQLTPAEQRDRTNDTFIYRESAAAAKASAAAGIDWRNAIREVKGPIGGAEGIDVGQLGGGETGSAEQGPISFETQWYDWGPYAQSMVSKIRVNWYANMPQLIRTGIGGVVTIRFTIQRDGRITDVTILKTSGHPPYDFAARKAIELSSPLAQLPADFPNASERVTAMFYYNMAIPGA